MLTFTCQIITCDKNGRYCSSSVIRKCCILAYRLLLFLVLCLPIHGCTTCHICLNHVHLGPMKASSNVGFVHPHWTGHWATARTPLLRALQFMLPARCRSGFNTVTRRTSIHDRTSCAGPAKVPVVVSSREVKSPDEAVRAAYTTPLSPSGNCAVPCPCPVVCNRW